MKKETNRSKWYQTNLIVSLRFGLITAIIGFLLHAVWGNLQEVKYTIVTGFIIGICIGLIEPIFSRTRIKKWPYYLVLIIRTILYFSIIVVSVYAWLLVYLKSKGLESSILADPPKVEEISEVYFLANVNFLSILILVLTMLFIDYPLSLLRQSIYGIVEF